MRPAIYDGDTPRAERAAIRKRSNLILTNPDMLHVGILPHHDAWGDCSRTSRSWSSTRRTSTGACSAHTSPTCCGGCDGWPRSTAPSRASCWPARRSPTPSSSPSASRVSTISGSSIATRAPQATRRGRDVESAAARRAARRAGVGALRGRRGARPSSSPPAPHDLLHEVAQGRRADPAPFAARSARARAGRADRAVPRRLHARRSATRSSGASRSGELLGVVATDALELGIDIGELDAAVCVTFPGTVASLRQMWGQGGPARAWAGGLHRRRRRARPVLLPPPRRRSCRVRSRRRSSIRDNSEIYAEHLLCAAHEAPLSDADEEILGAQWHQHAQALTAAGLLRERATGFVPRRADDYPAARVGPALRIAGQLRPDRPASGEVLGTIEAGARVLDRPRGRGLSPSGALVHRARARPRRAAGVARAVRRRLFHADQAREHDLHRAADRAPRCESG